MAEIVSLSEARLADEEAIVRPLNDANLEHGVVWNPLRVVLALRRDGEILGGLIGSIHWDWLSVDILGVDARLRGQGYGAALMARAEEMGRAAGCVGSRVETHSFQAPGFYERIGYERYADLPDNPKGHSRLMYRKDLTV